MGGTRISIAPGRFLSQQDPVLVVAEIGQNHNGSRALAEQLLDAAAWAGADAVKFVKRDLRCELSAEARFKRYDTRHAFGRTYGEHRQALELSAADHAALRDRAHSHGMLYFATACDIPSARLLAELGVSLVKVASRDLSNLPLLEYLAAQGRPIVLSTGMSDLDEVDAAVRVLRAGTAPIVLMQCTSLYPTPVEEAHLRSLATLRERYGLLVGYSDHTRGYLLPPLAVALGAVAIEKHLTLDRGAKGTDHACSLEPDELRQMIENIRAAQSALGRRDKPLAPGVGPVRAKLGRSLVTRVPLTAGTYLEEPMLTLKCPGDGISWLERSRVVGRRLRRDVGADEKLTLDDVV